jgi:hypothetical protein
VRPGGSDRVPAVFWHIQLSNAKIIVDILIPDTLVAFQVYRIMLAFQPTLMDVEKTGPRKYPKNHSTKSNTNIPE